MVFLAAFLAGILNLFSKDLLNAGLGPMEICFCREGVTAAAFFLILLVIDRSAFKVRLRDLGCSPCSASSTWRPTSACSRRRRPSR